MRDKKYIYVKLYQKQDDKYPAEFYGSQRIEKAKDKWKTDKDIKKYFQKLGIYELPQDTEKYKYY